MILTSHDPAAPNDRFLPLSRDSTIDQSRIFDQSRPRARVPQGHPHLPNIVGTRPRATHDDADAGDAPRVRSAPCVRKPSQSLAMSSSSYDSGFNEGVRALTTMFPDIDPHTIRTVLDARDGHVESAVEKLLAMSRRGGGAGGGAAPGAMGMSPMRCVCERVGG